jgi:hypothetical protein
MNYLNDKSLIDKRQEKINFLLAISITFSVSLAALTFVLLNWNSPKHVFATTVNAGIAISIFLGAILATSAFMLDRTSNTYRKELFLTAIYLVITFCFTAGAYAFFHKPYPFITI